MAANTLTADAVSQIYKNGITSFDTPPSLQLYGFKPVGTGEKARYKCVLQERARLGAPCAKWQHVRARRVCSEHAETASDTLKCAPGCSQRIVLRACG